MTDETDFFHIKLWRVKLSKYITGFDSMGELKEHMEELHIDIVNLISKKKPG